MRRVPGLAALLVLGLQIGGAGPAGAADGGEGDLRGLVLGLKAAELPGGFRDFACAEKPEGPPLSGFAAYAACPADARGWHAVAFRFDPAASPRARLNPAWGETRVAGHPVRLAALFDEKGRLVGLDITTDPAAPPVFRRRAYLFGEEAMDHFGRTGWRCEDTPPAPGEAPVGGLFIHRRCEKETPTRRYEVRTALYRRLPIPEGAGAGTGGEGGSERSAAFAGVVNGASLLIRLPDTTSP